MVGITGEVERRVAVVLQRYIERGISPGDFWIALLSNDLIGTYGHADAENLRDLAQILVCVTNTLPVGAWGSKAQVSNWMAAGGKLQYAESEVV